MRLAQGRTDAAAAVARRLLTETGDVVRRSKVLAGCTELPIAAGDVDAAREAAAELNDIALRFGCTALLVQAASCRAAVELADGDAASARPELRARADGKPTGAVALGSAATAAGAPGRNSACRAAVVLVVLL